LSKSDLNDQVTVAELKLNDDFKFIGFISILIALITIGLAKMAKRLVETKEVKQPMTTRLTVKFWMSLLIVVLLSLTQRLTFEEVTGIMKTLKADKPSSTHSSMPMTSSSHVSFGAMNGDGSLFEFDFSPMESDPFFSDVFQTQQQTMLPEKSIKKCNKHTCKKGCKKHGDKNGRNLQATNFDSFGSFDSFDSFDPFQSPQEQSVSSNFFGHSSSGHSNSGHSSSVNKGRVKLREGYSKTHGPNGFTRSHHSRTHHSKGLGVCPVKLFLFFCYLAYGYAITMFKVAHARLSFLTKANNTFNKDEQQRTSFGSLLANPSAEQASAKTIKKQVRQAHYQPPMQPQQPPVPSTEKVERAQVVDTESLVSAREPLLLNESTETIADFHLDRSANEIV